MCDALRPPSHLLQAAGVCVVLGKVCYQLADEFERSLQVHPDTPVRWVFPNPLRQAVWVLKHEGVHDGSDCPVDLSDCPVARVEDRDVAPGGSQDTTGVDSGE